DTYNYLIFQLLTRCYASSVCFHPSHSFSFSFFFFNDTATPEIYTLSLHDALPIWSRTSACRSWSRVTCGARYGPRPPSGRRASRSEEHTSELQSRENLVCRLLLEKKKKKKKSVHREMDKEASMLSVQRSSVLLMKW